MAELKKYLVQACRRDQHNPWVTDTKHDDLNEAVSAARVLHTRHQRVVRVIDQEETVFLRLGRFTDSAAASTAHSRMAKQLQAKHVTKVTKPGKK